MSEGKLRQTLSQGQKIRCLSIETGELEGVCYWAFADLEVDSAFYEIYCKVDDVPADLVPGAEVEAVIDCMRIAGDGAVGVFLSRVRYTEKATLPKDGEKGSEDGKGAPEKPVSSEDSEQ